MKSIKLERSKIKFFFKKSIFILLTVLLGCNVDKYPEELIEYDLGDRINKAIEQEIKNLSYSKLNYKKDKFYIFFSDFSLDKATNKFTLAYCEDCSNQELILKTNRFSFVDDIKIPILFESDFFFTEEKIGDTNRKNYYRAFFYFDQKKEDITVSIDQ